MMNISFAKDSDISPIRHIWKECFGDTESYMDFFFSSVFKCQNTLVAKEDNTCIGALQMFPHEMIINGSSFQSMYIGGVSVLPSYRNHGIATKLMYAAEEYMKSINVDISFLVPFSFSFYNKLGYRCISYLSEFTGPVAALKPFCADFDIGEISTKRLVSAYDCFSRQTSLYLKRDIFRYKNEIFPLCGKVSVCSLAENNGYFIYEVKNRRIFVLEIAYRDESSLRQLLGYIDSQKDNADTFVIRASADGLLRKVLCENTICENRFPHAMAKSFTDFEINDSMHNYINMLGWF